MPDYMYMLESRLSAEQRAALSLMQELAGGIGANLYLTGGAVRDLIAGRPIRDLDFTLEGNPSRLVRDLEKAGAQILSEDEKRRHIELRFAGDVDGSVAAAYEEVYARPGARPEIRWSTVMEDLRRRDFSLNAVAISLNPASRGLLLDPTNGLADLEKREVRALSAHSFTNHPVRLLRAIRYATRMDFELESRTEDWFALAIERGLRDAIPPEEAGEELRALAREERPVQILKAWEGRDLLGVFHPQLARRHPHYEMLAKIVRARDEMIASGLHPRLLAPVTYATLARLKPRERSAALGRMGFRAAEVEAVGGIEDESRKLAKALAGRKTAAPADAFAFLERAPGDVVTFLLAWGSNTKALGKIRQYLTRWRPLRRTLAGAVLDLEALGVERGPKFDRIIEELFRLQLAGKGRSPEDRIKLLRKLAGIKEPPKKAREEKKPAAKAKKTAGGPGTARASAAPEPAKPKPPAAPAALRRPVTKKSR